MAAVMSSLTFICAQNKQFTVNGISFAMTYVKGGIFSMGATPEQVDSYPDEKPCKNISVNSFYLASSEVTQALWTAVMKDNPSFFQGPQLPVENVSWNECQQFIKKINELTGKSFRLPTEAEWEYAARGASRSQRYQYSGSNNVEAVAWYAGNSGFETHVVASKQFNEIGLFGMSGNVSEWCQDTYVLSSYDSMQSPYRIVKGGCWNDEPRDCRVARKSSRHFDNKANTIGFRLALSE